jgi:hypothetical protein
MRLSVLVLAAGFCLLSTMAQAQLTNDFLQQYAAAPPERKSYFLRQVVDIEDGLAWANMALARDRKEQPLYCVPTNLALTGGQLINIVRRDVEETPSDGEYPVGLILLQALKKVFPCQPASR